MTIHGLERADSNNNQYPMVFTMATRPTNPAPFYQQVNEKFAPLRETGLRPVGISAFLEKIPFEPSGMHDFVAEIIMKNINKRKNFPSTDNNDHDIVFVWDIDEVTMMSNSYLSHVRTLRQDIDTDLVYTVMQRVLALADFDEDVSSTEEDVVNLEDAFIGETDEMRNAASKYYTLLQIYNDISKRNGKSFLPHELLELCGMIERKKELRQVAKKHQQVFNGRWKYTKRCMELVNTQSEQSKNQKYANVVLCQEGVASGLVQLLASGYSSLIPVENVYATFSTTFDQSVFDRIQERFGAKCLVLHVTAGPRYGERDYCHWPLRANESIKALYQAQKNVLLEK